MKDDIEKIHEDIIIFEKEIKAYEDTMFGLTLYQETAPKWVKALQKISYQNMKKRGQKAIQKAKGILVMTKSGKSVQNEMKYFEWPVILDDMRFRIDMMLKCYEELFPIRPRDKSLSKEEITALRNEAMNRI